MERKKQSRWNFRKYDGGPRHGNVVGLGKCLVPIDTSLEGISSGNNEENVCGAVTGPCLRRDVYRLRNSDRHDSYRTDQALRLAPEI